MDNKIEYKITPEIVEKIEDFLEERKRKDRRDEEPKDVENDERRSAADRRATR